jgi:hypothetical protein
LAGEAIVRRYAVLIGLTPLVPIPFIDDVIRGYLRRRLVRALFAERGEPLSDVEARVLADEWGRGGLAGCLLAPIVYLLKKVFRKIFFFLEWKRAVDIASGTYHFGTLLDHALEKRWCGEGAPYTPARVRAAIEAVLARVGTGPVEKAIAEAFGRSRDAMAAAARGLRQAARGMTRRISPAQTEQVIAAVERDEAPEIAGVAAALDQALESVAPSYFQRLEALLLEELSRVDAGVTVGSAEGGAR